jgi:RNA polymerase sigma factor (sigma-70 family)
MFIHEANQAITDSLINYSHAGIVADSTATYLHEISQLPLLTAEEEKLLGICIKYGTKDEAKMAKGRLIATNLRLAVSIARNYVGRGLSLMDLIQEGNKGLLRTANRFDYGKGYRFSTYASWWIREQITRAIARQIRAIRTTALVLEVAKHLLHTGHGLADRFEMEAPPEDIIQLAKEIKQDTSPDTMVSEEGYSYLDGVSYSTNPKQGYLEFTRVGQDRVQRVSCP